jgi:hypothetical protein
MRSRLLPLVVVLLGVACGPTGPDSRSGPNVCAQLKECICDPARTTDVAGCEQTVDTIEGLTNGLQICRAQLTNSGCGQLLNATPPGF